MTKKEQIKRRIVLRKQIKKLSAELVSLTPKKKRSASYGRRKGLSFERWAAIQLRSLFPRAKRHLEMQAAEAQGFDLDCTGNLRIQCKAFAKYAPLSHIEEVVIKKGVIPVLLTKGKNKEPIAALYFKDFIKILTDIGEVYDGTEKESDEEISESDF